jgi:queuine tRNA-ribosyltransferase
VMPTRLARHGTALTGWGRVQVKSARFARADEPLDPGCSCGTCRRYPAAYLRHLLLVGEPTAGRLLTLHNLAWMACFTASIRRHIERGTFGDLRIRVGEAWEGGSLR